MYKKTTLVKTALLALVSVSTHAMEEVVLDMQPSLDPEHIVKQLSLHIFNRESDVQFEKTFLRILKSRKDPKLYPELISMREHILQELNYRSKGE